MKLAPLSKEERITMMINDLAHLKGLGSDETLMIQLAIDEGLASSSAAAAMLRNMDEHRDEYTHTGFAALFRVLRGIGDKSQGSLIGRFLEDSDDWVAHYAQQVFGSVQSGLRCQYAAGF